MSAPDRCHVGFIHEISQRNIQSTNAEFSHAEKMNSFQEWTAKQTARDHIQKYVEIGYYSERSGME